MAGQGGSKVESEHVPEAQNQSVPGSPARPASRANHLPAGHGFSGRLGGRGWELA